MLVTQQKECRHISLSLFVFTERSFTRISAVETEASLEHVYVSCYDFVLNINSIPTHSIHKTI